MERQGESEWQGGEVKCLGQGALEAGPGEALRLGEIWPWQPVAGAGSDGKSSSQ